MDSEKAVKAATRPRYAPLAVSVKPDISLKELTAIIETIGRERGCLACGLGGPLIIGPELPEAVRLRDIAAVTAVGGPDRVPWRAVGAAGF